jgi:hypothetical protein
VVVAGGADVADDAGVDVADDAGAVEVVDVVVAGLVGGRGLAVRLDTQLAATMHAATTTGSPLLIRRSRYMSATS